MAWSPFCSSPLSRSLWFLWVRILKAAEKKDRPVYALFLLSHLCVVPAFLVAIDWGRWFGAFLTMQALQLVILAAKRMPRFYPPLLPWQINSADIPIFSSSPPYGWVPSTSSRQPSFPTLRHSSIPYMRFTALFSDPKSSSASFIARSTTRSEL